MPRNKTHSNYVAHNNLNNNSEELIAKLYNEIEHWKQIAISQPKIDDNFENKVILITGGTGSFGKICTKELLLNHKVTSVRIYSRDELKQWEMKNELQNYPNTDKLRFFIGDVRDAQRLKRACEGANFIIHTAALKQVPACEYNPIEAVKTNVLGAVNVIDAALDCQVEKVVALSTDKASHPINLYGATKLCSDKLFIQANNYRGNKPTAFSVVRYGNVMASRGSVIPLFLEQAKTNTLTVTHQEMTRFWITLYQAVQFVLTAFPIMQGGELFVPKIPSMKIIDLAKVIAPKAKITITGIRPGEKMHESLICQDEAPSTFDIGDRYLIAPTTVEQWNPSAEVYSQKIPVPTDFNYDSKSNPWYLTAEDMQEFIRQLCNPTDELTTNPQIVIYN